MSEVHLEGVTKIYANGVRAVDDFTLHIPDGEFTVLVGPSGCGKSTILRMVAGLEEVDGGSIAIGGRDVTHLAPRARDVAMVFQSYALYPHMTVGENCGFALKLQRLPRNSIRERVGSITRLLGLTELLDRRPAALSGGQRQRVAIGRAIVREPRTFLMDEPLSNLDAKLRVSMRAELARMHHRLGTTTIYVTHDQVEAMTLGDRVVVLRDGVLQQCDTPQRLFERPRNLFVAAFIGSPQMNLVEARLADGRAHFAQASVPLTEAQRQIGEGRVILGVRPSDLAVTSATGDTAWLTAKVDVIEELGSERHVIFAIDAPRVATDATRAALEGAGDDEARLLADDPRAQFVATVPGRGGPRIGDTIGLTIDPEVLHFFDPETGDALGHAAGAPVAAG
jgi:multiple sugar transport system ATP-binding protein